MMERVYPNSIKKIFIVFFVFFVFFLIMGIWDGLHSKWYKPFDINIFIIDFSIGLFFGALLLGATFRAKLILTEQRITYYPSFVLHFLDTLFKKENALDLSEIQEVRLGTPRLNKNVATFAAINIASANKEITFNSDLFEKGILQCFFKDLQQKNPSIKFDNYSLSIIQVGSDQHIFAYTVLKNFILTALLLVINGILFLLLYGVGVLKKETVVLLLGSQLIFVPLVFNRFAKFITMILVRKNSNQQTTQIKP